MRTYILILILALALALSGLGHADASVNYTLGHIQIQRTLTVHQIGRIDPGTGAAMPQDESTISLQVTNTGPLDLNDVSIEENLDYLPPFARLAFSQQPVSDGRNARWVDSVLPAGGSFSVWFSTPVSVPDQAVLKARAPTVSFTREVARLSLPPVVQAGQDVTLRLRTPDGQPVSGALIEVSAPDGNTRQLQTDSGGRATFTADAAGFYTYGVPDYDVGFISSTEAQAAEVVVPPTAATLTPGAPKPAEAGFVQTLWSLAPLAIGLMLVAAIAFALYTYFNTMPGGEDEPMPPTPAIRPVEEESADQSGTAVSMGTASVDMKPPSAPVPAYATSAAAPSKPSEGLSQAQEEEALLAGTRALIAKRRAAAPKQEPEATSTDEELAASGEQTEKEEELQEEEMPGQHSQAAGESKKSWGFTEGTYVPPGPDESEEEEEGPMPADRAPEWMTQAQAPEGEMAEIDDEAIAKTIEELEQLRAELQERAAKGKGAGMVSKRIGVREGRAMESKEEAEDPYQRESTAPEAEEIVPAFEEPSEPAEEEAYVRPIYPRRASAPKKAAPKKPQKKSAARTVKKSTAKKDAAKKR